jgi:hypothetical protein
MRRILLHNWKEKLVCLLLGAVVWYLIRQNLGPPPERRALHADSSQPAIESSSKHGAKNTKKTTD